MIRRLFPLPVPLLAVALGAQAGSANPTPPAADVNPTVMVLGDSLSAAWGIREEDGWVALLAERLEDAGGGWRVVNASMSGETTDGGRQRLALAIEAHAPRIVILELGGNDALQGHRVRDIRANLMAMANAARRRGVAVILVGMQIHPNLGPRYSAAFRDMFGEVADRTGANLVPFLLDGVDLDAMLQEDQVHPTAAAQPILLENVWKVLAPMLADG